LWFFKVTQGGDREALRSEVKKSQKSKQRVVCELSILGDGIGDSSQFKHSSGARFIKNTNANSNCLKLSSHHVAPSTFQIHKRLKISSLSFTWEWRC
jgi:hypothetical protein